ncbi:F-box/kelch-repeat protein At3g23880-like [Juglans regia]|uniref:F-box/kelch-repeat protein At3g23880-like n=2 Tax=Juglans regia TaxID=51240 RepID=A0A2I4HAY0_JUGRE|nr:F-box/kelch-repeat protein At3g23880-like [Juglans regia]XP_018854916.2 F-box/kelch-repeat protein At3g23880-like [Juglans regia]
MVMNNHFPEDLLLHILVWLPVISLSRFKCVCKSWYAFISDQTFIYEHLLHTQSPSNRNKNAFFLVNRRDKITSKHVVSTLSHETLQVSLAQVPLPSPYSGIINKKVEIFIVGSCDGLVCLHDNCGLNTLLWNPATKETKVVPVSNLPGLPANYSARPNGIGFGFDAKTHNYKIIRNFRFFENYPNLDMYEMALIDEYQMGVMFYSEVYSLRTDSWTQVDNLPFCIWNAFGGMKTNLNGIGNWWASDSDWEGIVSFDVAKEVFLITPMPNDSLIYNGYRYDVEYFLLNELVAVAISWKKRHAEWSPMCWDVWLLNEYGVRESWTKLFRVGPLTGICRPLEFWRNDIIFFEKDGQLALYDVSTKEMMSTINLQIDGDQVFSFQVISYMESLVSISGLIN